MRTSLDQAVAFRKKLLEPDGEKNYAAYRNGMVAINEGYDRNDPKSVEACCKIYLVNGIKHIGAGFNLEDAGARGEWMLAFGTGKDAPDFDAVVSGKQAINQSQVENLLHSGLNLREKYDLKDIFGDAWNKLKPNERAAIQHMHFNTPGIVTINPHTGKETRFAGYIKTYVATGDREQLNKAVDEVLNKSNRNSDLGLGFRRVSEAALLDTYGDNTKLIEEKNTSLLAIEGERQAEKVKKKAIEKSKSHKNKTPKIGMLELSDDVQKLAMAAVNTKMGVQLDEGGDGTRPTLVQATKTPSREGGLA